MYEWLKAILWLGAAFWVLRWLFSGTKSATADGATSDEPLVDDMREIGNAAGMLGGSIEDAYVARFAIRRAKLAQREAERSTPAQGDVERND